MRLREIPSAADLYDGRYEIVSGIYAFQDASRGAQRRWIDKLRNYAPVGIDPGERNGIGDAFRHYETSGIVSGIVGPDLATLLGDGIEMLGDNPDAERQSDEHNNDLGAEAGRNTTDPIDVALDFMNDVATGQVKVVDKRTGEIRNSRGSDLRSYDGDRLEDRYQPERSFKDPIGDSGETMNA